MQTGCVIFIGDFEMRFGGAFEMRMDSDVAYMGSD